MSKFARPTSYNGRQSNQNWTGSVKAANEQEAEAGLSNQLYISPATLADAVQALVPLATPTVAGIVTVTAAPFDTGAVATKAYADNLAIAGAPISEPAVNGIGEIATDVEAIAGTANNPGVTALFLTPSNLSPVFASPPAIGGTAPAGGAFTTLSASGAFSLTGDTVDVAEGGTGASSLTDHGVLIGSGTAAVTPLVVGTNGQILVGSTGADPVFATAASSLSSITNTLGAGTFSQDISENWLRIATVTIATGDVLTMATTPVEIVAAPGAGKFIEFISAQLILDYNSIAYTEAGDNLAFRYTNGSGVIVSQTIESTGFIDQSADTITNALPKIDAIVAASGAVNQAIVLDNTGSDFGAGNSPLIVKVAYRVIASGL